MSLRCILLELYKDLKVAIFCLHLKEGLGIDSQEAKSNTTLLNDKT